MPRYHVDFLSGVAALIRDGQRTADREGFGAEFLAAMSNVYRQLQASADTVGEPLYDLPHARLQVRQAVIRPVVIEFGVHYSAAVVFVRSFRLLPPA